MKNERIIRFEDVTIKGHHDVTIVELISFSVQRGQKILISGPSGSGKSTLLLSVLGYIKPASGTIYYREKPVSPETVRIIRQEVAYVPQNPVPGAENVRDALLLPFTFKANSKFTPDHVQIAQVLEMFGFDEQFLKRETDRLSGGEKQRLVLARAFLLNRDILLVDEPASSLDVKNERNVLDMLLQNNKTIIAVSHNPDWRESFDKCIDVFSNSYYYK